MTERRAATPLERTLLTLLLGVLLGLVPPTWTFAQRLTTVERDVAWIRNAVERTESRLNARP